jgi:hypothetical protein
VGRTAHLVNLSLQMIALLSANTVSTGILVPRENNVADICTKVYPSTYHFL